MVTASIFGLGAILDPGNAELLVLSHGGECSKTRIEALTDIRAFDVFNFSFMK